MQAPKSQRNQGKSKRNAGTAFCSALYLQVVVAQIQIFEQRQLVPQVGRQREQPVVAQIQTGQPRRQRPQVRRHGLNRVETQTERCSARQQPGIRKVVQRGIRKVANARRGLRSGGVASGGGW